MLSRKRIRKLLLLSWSDRWLLAQSMFWLIFIKLGLYVFRFQTLCEMLTKAAKKSFIKGDPDQGRLDSVVWAIGKSSRLLPGEVNCLPKALAAQVMLSQRGYDVEVVIGARRNDRRQLNAHAWIEYQGKVIIGDVDDLAQFAPLRRAEVTKL